jgi:hypothetical protein
MFSEFPVPPKCGGISFLPIVAALKYDNIEVSRILVTTVIYGYRFL